MEESERNLLAAFEKSSRTEHRGLKGDARASKLADFLTNRLPSGYGVLCRGEAVDYLDARSGEIDILIFDKTRNALLSDDPRWIPVEALLAYIEVKSVLTADELREAFSAAKKINSLRPFKQRFTLSTKPSGVSPQNEISLSQPEQAGVVRCFRSVFAYKTNLNDSDWLDQEWKRAREAAKQTDCPLGSIDRIIVLNRGLINVPFELGTDAFELSSAFQQWFIHLANFLARENRRREPVDWQLYTKKRLPGWRKLPT